MTKAELASRAVTHADGEWYGLPIPRSPREVLLLGADWLTKAFRKAGTLQPSNRVLAITDSLELEVLGGADCAVAPRFYKRDDDGGDGEIEMRVVRKTKAQARAARVGRCSSR